MTCKTCEERREYLRELRRALFTKAQEAIMAKRWNGKKMSHTKKPRTRPSRTATPIKTKKP